LLIMSFYANSEDLDSCTVFKNNISGLVVNEEQFDVAELEKCISTTEIPDSEYYLGLIYLHGINVLKDYEKGLTHLFNSANGGNLNALVALGEFYIIDNDAEVFNQGVSLLEMAMERGHKGSIIKLFSLMSAKRIPMSDAVTSKFESLVADNFSDAIVFQLNLAISESITTDDITIMEDVFSRLKLSELEDDVKGEIHYLIARAYITDGTSFYSIPRVKSELKTAALYGHQGAQKLLDGIEKIEEGG